MKRTLATLALATGASLVAAGPAEAARPAPGGVACQRAGIATLQSLGLLDTVARDGIEVDGVGVVAFRDVLALHRSSPELFQTGGVSVVVPGVGTVPATWCDGV